MDTAKIDITVILPVILAIAAAELAMDAVAEICQCSRMLLLGCVRLIEAGLIIAVLRIRKRDLDAIGLKWAERGRGFTRGLLWSGGFGLLVLLAGFILFAAGINPLTLVRTPLPSTTGETFLFFAVGGLAAPLAEEFFFRGILYGFFRRWGLAPALVLSTLCFVLAHTSSPGLPIPQITGGILFALAYERERNILVPVTIHALGNWAIFAVSLLP